MPQFTMICGFVPDARHLPSLPLKNKPFPMALRVSMASRAQRGTAPTPRPSPVAVADCAFFNRCGSFCRCGGLCSFLPLSGTLPLRVTGREVGANGPDTPKPPFLPFFQWYDLFLTGSHNPPLVITIPLPPSKFYSPMYGLILIMFGQCTNSDPPYPCPAWLHPFIKSKYACKFSNCRSWVHQKCSELANPTLYHDV